MKECETEGRNQVKRSPLEPNQNGKTSCWLNMPQMNYGSGINEIKYIFLNPLWMYEKAPFAGIKFKCVSTMINV